jgi:hypothetical protein
MPEQQKPPSKWPPHRTQVTNWLDVTSQINQCPGAGFAVNGTNQTKIDGFETQ